jgi:hypothetical protein
MYKVLHNEQDPVQNRTFRPTAGIGLSWRGGDVVQPYGGGNWFDPPFFERVLHVFVPWRILPFINWRIGTTVGYLGFKAWGVDSEHYLNWLPADRVKKGSVALVFSARFDAADH